MKKIKFCCSDCGSTDVKCLAYVDVNTHKFVDHTDLSDYICNNCFSDDFDLLTIKEYKDMKNQHIYWKK